MTQRSSSSLRHARARARGGRGRDARRGCATGGWTRSSSRSTSRRASSRPSCAGARSPRCPTSPPASAGSARSPTRLSSSAAMEDVCGVEVIGRQIRALRRLLYCGEWIESHAPARVHAARARLPGLPERVRDGARPSRDRRGGAGAQEGGQRADAGGRGPGDPSRSTCASAGSTGRPPAASCGPLVPQLEAARSFDARRTVAWTAGLRLPRRSRRPASYVALSEPDALCDRGRHVVRTSGGLDLAPAADYERALRRGARGALDRAALHASRRRRRVPVRAAGPVGAERRPALAAGAARPPPRPGSSAVVTQSVSQHHRCGPSRSSSRSTRRCASSTAYDRARPAVRARWRRARASATARPRRPRGMLWHSYRHRRGRHRSSTAMIVPPTSQNQAAHRADHARLRRAANLDLPDEELRTHVRAGDPQLRPVHLLLGALPRPRHRPRHEPARRRWSSASGTRGAATTARPPSRCAAAGSGCGYRVRG